MSPKDATTGTILWLTDIGALPEATLVLYGAWFGEAERQRCTRFVRTERRRQFIAGRALLRLTLGRLLKVAPASIVLRERSGDAPALDMPLLHQHGVSFSISHSGPWVACAASTETAVGLDIEQVDRTRDILAIAGQAFGEAAAARLADMEEGDRARAFYRMWCRHEAHIKLGCPATHDYVFEQPGLAIVLSSAHSLAPAPEPRLLDLAALLRAAEVRDGA